MPQDVALPEANWVRHPFSRRRMYEADGWRCQICQTWLSDTDLMVDHLFRQHSMAPVYVGVASIYVEGG